MSENSGGEGSHPNGNGDNKSSDNKRRNRGKNGGNGSGTKFEGKCEDLKGYVYDVQHGNATESFQKTTQEIAEYVSKEYEKAGEFRTALVNLEFEELVEPTIDDEEAENRVKVLKYERLAKAYDAKVEARAKNEGKAFPLILGQCSPAMRDRIEASEKWKAVNAKTDVIGLLKLIQSASNTKQTKQEPSHTLMEAYREFFSFRQVRLSNSDYLQAFKDRLEVLERLAGEIGNDDDRVLDKYASMAATISHSQAQAACREEFIATNFLFGADKIRYGDLLVDMQNEYIISGRPYPATLTDAYNILVNYKPKQQNRDRNKNRGGSEGMAFVQEEDEEEENDNKPSARGQGRGKGGRGGRNRGGGRGNGGGSKGNTEERAGGNKGPDSNANFILQEADNVDSKPGFPAYSVDLRPVESCLANNTSSKRLPPTWLIMDSASSVDLVSNREFLINIHKAEAPLRVLCNAGVVEITHKATMPGYPNDVWYHPNGVANILGLHNVGRCFRVTYDSSIDDAFHLHRKDGTTVLFTPSEKGLYRLNTDNEESVFTASLLVTTKDKKSSYDTRGYRQAEMARKVQNIIMRPSSREYMDIVTKGFLRNCPVEKRHIQAAEDIFGANIGALKGKTPRRTTSHVVVDKDPVPEEVMGAHKNVTLAIDIMFVNGIPFFVTISRGIRFGTVESLNNRQIGTIKQCLVKVIATYQRRGFTVDTILADDEFSPLRNEIPGVDVNCCGADEHVPEVERYIRTIKDRARSGYNDLPFEYIPRVILDRLIGNSVFWLNAFPHTGASYSPRYIMIGRQLDYNKHVRSEFGAYTQTHEQHDNSMMPRTVGAICLGPTGNAQGTHFFMSLQTGRLLRRPHWTELPMPHDVITRVSSIGRNQGMPRSLTFGDRYGHELFDREDEVDDDHDSTYDPQDDEFATTDEDFSVADYDSDDIPLPQDNRTHPTAGVTHRDADQSISSNNTSFEAATNTGSSDSDAGSISSNSESTQYPDEEAEQQEGDQQNWHNEGPDNSDHEEIGSDQSNSRGGSEESGELGGVHRQPLLNDHQQVASEAGDHETPETAGVDPTDNQQAAAGSTGVPEGTTTERDGMQLRPRNKNTPTHLVGRGFEDDFVFLTEQMSARAGLKKFGKKGADAIVAEMEQLHYRKVIKPMMGTDLTREEKRAALQYLMFLKQKRCGKIKARGCADGRKQRIYKTKEETRSPTVRTESLFLSAIVDAREGRCVATCDIPGAFMHADMDEVVHVRFDGPLAQLLARVDPRTYTKYLQKENGRDVLYVQLQKALYGTLQAAMLFWNELSTFLCGKLGFKINPYDACVANKIIDGKQCTILWHVDDLKISHVDQGVIDKVLTDINSRFGKETPITITKGKNHDYLGMTLDYSEAGKVKIKMDDFVERLLEEVPEDMKGSAATPAADHLFQVNKNGNKLDNETADLFHHLVAKLLYLCKRARPDLQTAVAFLTTRVTCPDEDDYKKLRRCICYLRATKELYLTLEADESGRVRWWVDASFAVHPDMKSHTGAVLSLGRGAACAMSTRQKINTKSSTEAELVGVDDAMPNIIWTRNFLKGQGYTVSENVVYQDNQSAILLERNGRASSGKRTRHVDIRYFFITDRIKNGEVQIQYCPTKEMDADVLTKPLQGSAFRKFRDRLLNRSPIEATDTPSQECVGETSSTSRDKESDESHGQKGNDVNEEDQDHKWVLVSSKQRRKRL